MNLPIGRNHQVKQTNTHQDAENPNSAKDNSEDSAFKIAFRSHRSNPLVGSQGAFQIQKSGAGDGTRTHDNLLGKQVLYQLSYARSLRRYSTTDLTHYTRSSLAAR